MRPTKEKITALRLKALEAAEELGAIVTSLRECAEHLDEDQHDRAAMSYDDAQEAAGNLEKIADDIRETAVRRIQTT